MLPHRARFILPLLSSLLPASALLAGAGAPAGVAGYYAQPAIHGDRIVFQSGGDLWTAAIPADGARAVAQRLTSATGLEARPMLSPDGTQVAFVAHFEGNPEVYVMPVAGGTPRRLTYHPDRDLPVGWTPDGTHVIVRSSRANPMGMGELYTVPASGGAMERLPYGEGALASVNPKTGETAFNRWSNESWYWKGYRGGTAPDLWIASKDNTQFRQATKTDENELFPMWIGDRLYFLSDTDGRMNIWSIAADGNDRRKHTKAGAQDFDLRWPSADTAGAARIAYAQGGELWLLETGSGAVRRLDIALGGDRLDERVRLEDPLSNVTELELSPDGKRLAMVSRGELLVGPVGKPEPGVLQSWMQLPDRAASRESGISWLDPQHLLLRTDAGGEWSIESVDVADLGKPGAGERAVAHSDRWIFDPQSSPDGAWIAYGDKSLRLMIVPAKGGDAKVVGTSRGGEIVEYRFSPDSRWLAWVETLPNGIGRIHLYDTQAGTDHCVSDGLTDDRHPRWDPKGFYLYFASARSIDPVLDQFDMAFTTTDAWNLYAVPLAAATPPPLPGDAAAAGFDLKKWSAPAMPDEGEEEAAEATADAKPAKDAAPAKDAKDAKDAAGAKDAAPAPAPPALELDGFMRRAAKLPVEAGTFSQVEPVNGGLLLLRDPVRGLSEDEAPPPAIGGRGGSLEYADLGAGECKPVLDGAVNFFNVSRDRSTAVIARTGGKSTIETIALAGLGSPGITPAPLKLDGVKVRVDPRAEWAQIFDEAWRLQRDFFWKPDMGGVDWKAVKARYAALLPRVGTRMELNDLVGEMCGELGNSHSYISGGDDYEKPAVTAVGLLGIDASPVKDGFRIERVLPQLGDEESDRSPLAAPHLKVVPGETIVAVAGRSVAGMGELGEALVGKVGQRVAVAVRGAGDNGAVRVIEVVPIGSEEPLRYLDWVESRRRFVDEKSGGRLGYVHMPDMGAPGLVAFIRGFYPQYDKPGLILDDRFNGGGFVSQMILERLKRRPVAQDRPREGAPSTYPMRAPAGPMAVLINENAGSDGDIFPTGFRLYGLGPVIGSRTWGGIVGIRDDKPFLDGGRATQPEFAFWEPKLGYGLENCGVVPDIDVPLTPADRAAGRDPQLERAIAEVLARLPKEPAAVAPVPDRTNSPVPPAAR
ncbi:MAG: LpqB family beta-propeller domain-containing protein [Phycisphaerales bacterium]